MTISSTLPTNSCLIAQAKTPRSLFNHSSPRHLKPIQVYPPPSSFSYYTPSSIDLLSQPACFSLSRSSFIPISASRNSPATHTLPQPEHPGSPPHLCNSLYHSLRTARHHVLVVARLESTVDWIHKCNTGFQLSLVCTATLLQYMYSTEDIQLQSRFCGLFVLLCPFSGFDQNQKKNNLYDVMILLRCFRRKLKSTAFNSRKNATW